ncbi:transposase [Celeribacter halophilus]|nr:transposase [Celeribacter halophilus]
MKGLHASGFSTDPLTEILRFDARQLIEQAVKAELAALLEAYKHETTEEGRARLVRHGYLPEREVMTGVGPVRVHVPRVRHRSEATEKVQYTSSILPPYLRKAKPIEELLPWLYLKGISIGGFLEALAALLGQNAERIKAATNWESVWYVRYWHT